MDISVRQESLKTARGVEFMDTSVRGGNSLFMGGRCQWQELAEREHGVWKARMQFVPKRKPAGLLLSLSEGGCPWRHSNSTTGMQQQHMRQCLSHHHFVFKPAVIPMARARRQAKQPPVPCPAATHHPSFRIHRSPLPTTTLPEGGGERGDAFDPGSGSC